VPFLTLLAAIAWLPVRAAGWWGSNRHKALVAALCALPVAVYLPAAFGAEGGHRLLETARDYVSFLALIGSLFVITGGIHVDGSLSGTPLMEHGIPRDRCGPREPCSEPPAPRCC
jgi:hypothetical protein